jgi:hypothetical protein
MVSSMTPPVVTYVERRPVLHLDAHDGDRDPGTCTGLGTSPLDAGRGENAGSVSGRAPLHGR